MNVTMSLDEKVVKESKIILKEQLNMTLSKYVEIQLRALVRSIRQPFKDVYEGVATDLFEDYMKDKKKVIKKKK